MAQRKQELHTLLSHSLAQAKADLIASLKASGSDCETALLQELTDNADIDWVASARAVLGHSQTELINDIERFDAALCQLELGLYGLCCDCEEPIEQSRLLADLGEQRCSRCAKQSHQKTA